MLVPKFGKLKPTLFWLAASAESHALLKPILERALTISQRVQVCQQILDLLLIQGLAERWHFVAAQSNDVGHAVIICRQTAQPQIFMLEYSLQTGPFFAARRIRFMAAIAVLIIDSTSGCLLGIQSKFRIGFTPFDVATQRGCQSQRKQRGYEQQVYAGPAAVMIDQNFPPFE